MSRKILITGSNGLLGQKLLHVLSNGANELAGIDIVSGSFVSDVEHQYHRVDLTDKRLIFEKISEIEPQIIIHTAAMTMVDKCEQEKEACWNINVKATDHIITPARKIGAKVIFISSDYVFDGKKGPYTENDLPRPINYYGKSKLAAENILRGSDLNWAIVRTIVLYGVGIKVRASFVTWLLHELRNGKSVNIVNDQWGNGTIVDDLAAGIERIISLDKTGIYNIASHEFISRYNFAIKVAKYFKLNIDLINSITTKELKQPALRPLRSGLDISKAERELYISFRTINEALGLYAKQEKN
ncbi:dTDP-4-dehydrorhamnose reductase [bacterium]|nr:dTDP-4-dehydrorhamnose reductase [bacterium]